MNANEKLVDGKCLVVVDVMDVVTSTMGILVENAEIEIECINDLIET